MNVVRVAEEGCAREDGRRETEGRRMSSSGTSSTRPLPHGAPLHPMSWPFLLSPLYLRPPSRSTSTTAIRSVLRTRQDSNEFRCGLLA